MSSICRQIKTDYVAGPELDKCRVRLSSWAAPHCDEMSLTVYSDPFSMHLNLSPDEARRLAAALLAHADTTEAEQAKVAA